MKKCCELGKATEEELKERRKLSLKAARKRWREAHPEYCAYQRNPEKGKAYGRDTNQRLRDGYVFKSLVQREKRQYVKREDLPDALLDIQRAIITLKRMLKEMR